MEVELLVLLYPKWTNFYLADITKRKKTVLF